MSSLQEKCKSLVGKVTDAHIKSLCEKLMERAAQQPSATAAEKAVILRIEGDRTRNNPHGNAGMVDETILRALPYLLGLCDASQVGPGSVGVSMDPFVAFPLAVFIERNGIPVKREKALSAAGSARVVKMPTSILEDARSASSAEDVLALLARSDGSSSDEPPRSRL
eukprot:TRINITY_DN64226_c0_g1_i1.p2 TRINITY_DN64226_c0_g1~~TRINITY_DN64226_c0_g1_i1.p2  ORF type:complete len:167 (-),score=43.86 TRINITY_DN64226_c0_g1_i1:325-825(-)